MPASSLLKRASQTGRFRMPAEWEPHAATWLAWPHYRDDWPGKFEPIPWVLAEIIRHLVRHERVELVVNSASAEKQARKVLERANALNANVRFHRWATNRIWLRDSGCIFVRDSSRRKALAGVKWRFNAWAKYRNWQHDEKIGPSMARAAGIEMVRPMFGTQPIVLEGGSIDVNGRGTMLTTEECLLSPVQSRNPRMAREHYEQVFGEHLGVSQVIWLGAGIAGDDTHGHVDDISRFAAPGTVVTAIESNHKDVNYAPLQENLRRLRRAVDQSGRPLNVVELPMPRPVIFEKRRLPASYANFYIANGVVLAPVFNDPNDRIALDTLAQLFPDREVTGIYSGDLIWGFGAMHCMTQQQPAA